MISLVMILNERELTAEQGKKQLMLGTQFANRAYQQRLEAKQKMQKQPSGILGKIKGIFS